MGDTHLVQRNGAACGQQPAPTDARDYVVDKRPTCERCAMIFDRMQGYARMQATLVAAKRGAPVPEIPPPELGHPVEVDEPEPPTRAPAGPRAAKPPAPAATKPTR